jgi:hypothetical protein
MESNTRSGFDPAGPAPRREPAGTRGRRDLVGTPLFWLTIFVTMCAAIPFAVFPLARAWMGSATLLMWTCFFTANALISRRTHSVISAPVYLLAAIVLAGRALDLIEVQLWMVWLVGGGIIAANVSERLIGKYL